MQTNTNEATLEEDWCLMNINTKEKVGEYTDRLGRKIPLMAEKIPPKQFSEPQVTKATRNMEVFTGVIKREKKKETVGIVPEKEEAPLKRYLNAASETTERQKNDLKHNSAHTQSFTEKDTCREGYHGYNMLEGHDKRARKLVDTNRNHYVNYEVSAKGVDEDAQTPYVAEKTTKKETGLFKRELAVGDGEYNNNLIKQSMPILTSAKLVVEGRTGGLTSIVDNVNIKSQKHRPIKNENTVFSSEHGQKNTDSNAGIIKPNVLPTNRQVLPQNKLRQKNFDTGAVLRGGKVSTMNVRDALFVDGINAPELEDCNIRSLQEREPGEDDPELESILIQQTLDQCRVDTNTLLNKDSTIEITETFGEDGPEAMLQHGDTIPSLRNPEISIENNTLEPEQFDKNSTRPEQLLGSSDATNNETQLVDSSSYRQGRVNVPKERKMINKEKINREAVVNESNIGASNNIRPGKRIINSYDAQNIKDFQDGSKFHETNRINAPNMLIGTSDGSENNRMGFLKGFMQSINHILPGIVEKEQLSSGKEQLKLPTGHLASGSALPMISQSEEPKEEILQVQRMANAHAPVHNNNVECNLVKSHAKRGVLNVDRLNSNYYGKLGVSRDAWIAGEVDDKKSGRGEYYRPPSAMSDVGSTCLPVTEAKKDSKPQNFLIC